MTADEFFSKWEGTGYKQNDALGFQCVAYYYKYCDEMGAKRNAPVGHARRIWEADLYDKNFWNKVPNTPTGVPKKGDVVLFKAMPGNPSGHVGIFVSGDAKSMVLSNQDGYKNVPAFRSNWKYTYALGWLTPIDFVKS